MLGSLLEILVPQLFAALGAPNCDFDLPSSMKFLRTFLAFLLLTAVLYLGTLHMPWVKERGEYWLISLWSLSCWDLYSSHTGCVRNSLITSSRLIFCILIVFSTLSWHKCCLLKGTQYR